MAAAEEGPSRAGGRGEGAEEQRQHQRRPSGLHRLLLRVQCVELAGSAASDDRSAADEDGGGGSGGSGGGGVVSPRQSRRRSLLGEGVCEVVALVETTARAICRCVLLLSATKLYIALKTMKVGLPNNNFTLSHTPSYTPTTATGAWWRRPCRWRAPRRWSGSRW